MSPPMLFLYLFLLTVNQLFNASNGQGLFPPVPLGSNFARNQAISATSTCGDGSPNEFCGPESFLDGAGCLVQNCDQSCPQSPPSIDSVDVLATTSLSGGVVSIMKLIWHTD